MKRIIKNQFIEDFCYSLIIELGILAEKNTGVPPKRAYVFYDCWGTINRKYKNWGHVGISVGESKVIHAWDLIISSHQDFFAW
jgi:hypothetical protein